MSGSLCPQDEQEGIWCFILKEAAFTQWGSVVKPTLAQKRKRIEWIRLNKTHKSRFTNQNLLDVYIIIHFVSFWQAKISHRSLNENKSDFVCFVAFTGCSASATGTEMALIVENKCQERQIWQPPLKVRIKHSYYVSTRNYRNLSACSRCSRAFSPATLKAVHCSPFKG